VAEQVCYLEIVVWGAQADACAAHLTKGRLIHVEGRLLQDRWDDADGVKRSKIVVVAEHVQFLPSGNGHTTKSDAPETPEPAGEAVPF
jgi:single-strand DNA-binding protein